MNDCLSDDITTKSAIIAKLRQADVSPTQQRIEIGQIFFRKHQHLSAEQVLMSIHRLGSKVSKATVYNTLGLFATKGLLKEVIVDSTKVFYDSNVAEHHHIYNIDTGELTDFHSERVDIEQFPVLPQGTKVNGVEVIIRVSNSEHHPARNVSTSYGQLLNN